jgi:hypothetical protein
LRLIAHHTLEGRDISQAGADNSSSGEWFRRGAGELLRRIRILEILSPPAIEFVDIHDQIQ